ncbi:hypothetical protein C8R44DRAFT_774089 [Mycena epipterygia]|nr:hypothetical protein C8R44DRAFT_774089 [Mycena epipterygia]
MYSSLNGSPNGNQHRKMDAVMDTVLSLSFLSSHHPCFISIGARNRFFVDTVRSYYLPHSMMRFNHRDWLPVFFFFLLLFAFIFLLIAVYRGHRPKYSP